MNAPAAIPDRVRLLGQLQDLTQALAASDDALFESRLAQLMREREEGLFVNVARLTRRLHEALQDLRVDEQLSKLTASDIPDACQRLDYVSKVTEEAAHKTLDLVERCQKHVQVISRPGDHQDRLRELRADLSLLAQAQEYQDLAGQVIKRVTTLVRNVESALLELLRASGGLKSGAAQPIQPASGELLGPTIPGLTPSAASQQDADALLSSLGF